ncbi:MAG TPA: tripartite tricarboxylate transporter substrate binding protein [Candidatus Acidoferrales bacterium]|nr:tripartite tricarboxylate transporter substrate binding protein [Candidatus Acidoferrales bacterium]
MNILKAMLRMLFVFVAFAASPVTAWAQQYPNHPIKLIVPFAPGGNTDVAGRLIADGIGQGLGQTIIVENKPGAGASIGAELAAKAPPDGYTLLLASDAQNINPAIYTTLHHDIIKDFEPVGLAMVTTLVLVASNSSGIHSVADLITEAKAKPGKVTYSSAGVGSGSHMAGALFDQAANIKTLHVPYKGSGPATTAVVAGEVDITYTSLAATVPFYKEKKLQALAITGKDPSPLFPGVPTTESLGFKGYEAGDHIGLLAPKGTPKNVIDRLNTELNKWLSKPETKARLEQLGFTPRSSTPAEYGAFIRSEVAKWDKTAKTGNIKVE